MTGPRDEQPSANPKASLLRNDRYILGAVILVALVGGLLLYGTRKGDEPSNQSGIISAPEVPAVPGGRK